MSAILIDYGTKRKNFKPSRWLLALQLMFVFCLVTTAQYFTDSIDSFTWQNEKIFKNASMPEKEEWQIGAVNGHLIHRQQGQRNYQRSC